MLPFFLLTEVFLWQSSFSLRGSASGGFCSVIKFLMLLLVAFIATPARADYPANTNAKTYYCVVGGCFLDATTACVFVGTNNGYATANQLIGYPVASPNSCSKPPHTSTYTTLLKKTTQCPNGGTFNSSTNMCTGANEPEGAQGVCNDKNPFIRRWDYGTGGGVSPAPDHYQQCVIEVIEMLVCRKEPSGVNYCMWMVKRTGVTYNGADAPGTGGNDTPDNPKLPPTSSPPVKPPANQPPGKSCPAGTVQAGSSPDGTPICMGTGSQPKNPQPAPPKIESSKSEAMPDGSTKKTDTVTQTNSDGSTTTNTTVTITKPDGSKETSGGAVTTTNSAGMAGKTDTPENDKYDLCKQNPHLSICRESSTSGTCGEITCVGDAIQCATLRAAAAMECKQRSDEQALKDSPLTAKGNAAISGSDIAGDNLPTAKNATVVNLPGSGDTAGWLGGGSPFDDVSFTVFGHSIILPFAKWSGYLIALRYALMVAASLISFRILSGSILRE